jgi:hypothetical protein
MRDDNTDEPLSADEPPAPVAPRDTTGSPADERAAAEDLRSTGDSIRADIRSLSDVEEEKRDLEADDPKVDRLSDQAVALANRIARQARAERQLSEEIG